jgi:hypothetical protein
MAAANAGKTVREILKGKRGAIRTAPLERGAPSWDDILDVVWEDLVKKAVADEPGFRTFKKLLGELRLNK